MKDKTINIKNKLHIKLKIEATKKEISIRELLEDILKKHFKLTK